MLLNLGFKFNGFQIMNSWKTDIQNRKFYLYYYLRYGSISDVENNEFNWMHLEELNDQMKGGWNWGDLVEDFHLKSKRVTYKLDNLCQTKLELH